MLARKEDSIVLSSKLFLYSFTIPKKLQLDPTLKDNLRAKQNKTPLKVQNFWKCNS